MSTAAGASAPPEPVVVMASAGRGIVEEICRSLQATVNRPVKPGSPDIATIAAADVPARLGGAGAAFCVELGGVCKGLAAIVLSSRVCAGLTGLLKGLADAELEKRIAEPLTEQDLEELGIAISGALAGIADRLAAAVGETPGLGLGDTVLLPADGPGDLPHILGRGPYPSATFDISVEKAADGKGLILFPTSFGVAQPATDPTMATSGMAAGESDAGAATGALAGLHPNIRRVLRLQLPVSVVVAEKHMPLEAVVKLSPGTIVEFSKSADDNLDVRVNDQRIATGEVVIIGERFGIQVKTVEGQRQRLQKMGMTGQ